MLMKLTPDQNVIVKLHFKNSVSFIGLSQA